MKVFVRNKIRILRTGWHILTKISQKYPTGEEGKKKGAGASNARYGR